MSKDKRSFFERLSGAVHAEDEQEAPSERHINPKSNSPKGAMPSGGKSAMGSWAEDDTIGELTIDMYQTVDDIVIKTLIAGVRPDDLDVSISRDSVTIKGKREESREVQDEEYYARELYWGAFSRTISLPQEIEVEEAEASERNGLLTIKLPKIDKNRETKLKVRSVNG